MFITVDQEKGVMTSNKARIDDLVRLLMEGALALMTDMEVQFKKLNDNEEEQEAYHGALYDMFNLYAGTVLDVFDKDRSPNTDLTAQAIMEAENAILDREVPDEAVEPTDDTDEENPA